MFWLLLDSVRKTLEQAHHSGFQVSTEQQARFEARFFDDDEGSGARVLTIAGDTAEIKIEGVLTNAPNFMAMMFGGGNTTYGDIIGAIASAEQSPEVEKIVLAINSPGGQFEGLFDVLSAIQAATKPITARVINTAASAAFAIASQAGEITASNRAARVGSIGIVASFDIDENEVKVSSTEAPKKNPDVTTVEGQAIVREELDAMHEIFVGAIATGRGTTVEKVNADFGQGATLLAEDAVSRGMIDAVADVELRIVKPSEPASSGNQPENATMNLQELRAQHPDVYAEAIALGATEERDRVSAHLTMGEASGDMKTAVAAIQDGSAMTSALQAKYMAAGMNRQDIEARADDDDDAGAGDDAGDDVVEGDADLVAQGVEAKLGIQPSTIQAEA